MRKPFHPLPQGKRKPGGANARRVCANSSASLLSRGCGRLWTGTPPPQTTITDPFGRQMDPMERICEDRDVNSPPGLKQCRLGLPEEASPEPAQFACGGRRMSSQGARGRSGVPPCRPAHAGFPKVESQRATFSSEGTLRGNYS